MRKRKLGKTDLYLTEMGLGGASIGNLFKAVSDQSSHKTIQMAWDLGIRYFDTAPEYGHGLSERRMGDALRYYPRNEYLLSTKVGDFLYARHDQLPPKTKFIDPLPFHFRYDYSYEGILRGFEDSLQRLGLNQIDIVLVHDLDPIIHPEKDYLSYFKIYVESGYLALAKLKEAGVIKAIGLGVKQWEVCEAAMKWGDYDCFMLQGNYTLLEQSVLNPFLNECLKKEISILLAGPFASGILATGAVKGAYFHHRLADQNILKRVEHIQTFCDEFKVPLPAAAIQFPLKHPAISSVVVGSASPEEMKKNIEYQQIKIPIEFWDALKNHGIIPQNAPV